MNRRPVSKAARDVVMLTARCAAMLCVVAAHGQDASGQDEERGSIEARIELGLPRVPVDGPAIDPVPRSRTSGVPGGIGSGIDWLEGLMTAGAELPEPSALAEGVVLRERSGSLWPIVGDLWAFVPEEADTRRGEGAMLLAPNGVLDRFVASIDRTGEPVRVRLSGLVLLYHRSNLLLLTNASRVSVVEKATGDDAGAPATAQAEGAAAVEQAAREAEQADVDELVSELQGMSRADTRREDALRERLLAAERARTGDSDGLSDARPPLLADDAYIAQRRARMERAGNGQWMLRFDGDDASLGDGRLLIMPCRLLMQMESRPEVVGGASMVVSGRVYTSRGQGYILPTMFRIERAGDVKPLQ